MAIYGWARIWNHIQTKKVNVLFTISHNLLFKILFCNLPLNKYIILNL